MLFLIQNVVADISKEDFKTNLRRKLSIVAPDRLQNASATFQSHTNTTAYDCIDQYVVIYINDNSIFSDSKEEELRHPRSM